MVRVLASIGLMIAMSAGALAQPSTNPAQANKSIASYVYLVNAEGDKILVTTQFWRNDPRYDERVLHRFSDVLGALEKRGFTRNEKVTIDSWDKPEPFVRCFIYLEDVQAGGAKGKASPVTGTRLWCSDNGASELELKASDSPKHVDEVMKRFDTYFARAKDKLHK